MALTIAPKFGPTLRTGVGSTAGAMADGSPAVGGGPAEVKRPKTAGGKIPSSLLEPRRGEALDKPAPPRNGEGCEGCEGPGSDPLGQRGRVFR